MDKSERKIYIAVIAAVIIACAYSTFTIQTVKKDLNSRLNTAENNLANQIGGLETKVDDIKRNLSMENVLQDARVEQLKGDSDKHFKTLTSVVEGIQKESSEQLESLKRELATISVESKDFSAIIEQVLPSVVSIQTDVGLGSGAIISKDGYIVTNYHVIQGANAMRIVAYSKDVYAGRVVGINANADVAVLKITGSHKEIWFADTRTTKVGEKVIALGNPGGLDFSVTEGIVSATNRQLPNGISYIQTDVPINPGNSGGPLVNKEGKIIGINNFKIKDFEGIGFAIDADVVEGIVDEIISSDQQAAT